MAVPIALLLQLASSLPGIFKLFGGGGSNYENDPVLKAVTARAGVLKSKTAKKYSDLFTQGIAGIGADNMLGSSKQRDLLVRLEEAKGMADAEIDTQVQLAEAQTRRDYAEQKKASQTNLLKTLGGAAGAYLGYTTGGDLSKADRLQQVLGYTSIGSASGGLLASAFTGDMEAGSAEEMVAGIRALSTPDVTELMRQYRDFMDIDGDLVPAGDVEQLLQAWSTGDTATMTSNPRLALLAKKYGMVP